MDKYALLWIYGDKDDTPYIVKNPPENFRQLLDEWRVIDKRYCETDDEEGWQPANVWLQAKGVEIVQEAEEITL